MITILKIGICAAVAYAVGVMFCKLVFIRALKCEKCGEIIPENEHRAHDFKCRQK